MARSHSVGRLSGQAPSTVREVPFDAPAVDDESIGANSPPIPDTSTPYSIDDFAMQMACATVFPMLECRCVGTPPTKATTKKEVSKNSKELVRAVRGKGPHSNGQIIASNLLCKDVRALLRQLPSSHEILDTEEEMAKTRFLNVFGTCSASMRFLARLGQSCDQGREIRALLKGVLEVNGLNGDLKRETRKVKGVEEHGNEVYDPELAWASVMTAPKTFMKKAMDSELVQRLTESNDVEIGGRGLVLSALLYQIGRDGRYEVLEQEWWTSDIRSPH